MADDDEFDHDVFEASLTMDDSEHNFDRGLPDDYLHLYRIIRVAPENRFTLTADQWDQFAKIMDKNPTPEQRDALINLLNGKTIFDK